MPETPPPEAPPANGVPHNLYKLGVSHNGNQLMIAVAADKITCDDDRDREIAATQLWLRMMYDRCQAWDNACLMPGQSVSQDCQTASGCTPQSPQESAPVPACPDAHAPPVAGGPGAGTG